MKVDRSVCSNVQQLAEIELELLRVASEATCIRFPGSGCAVNLSIENLGANVITKWRSEENQ